MLQLKLANYGLPPGTYSRKMAALDMDEAYEAFVLYADRRRSWHRYLRSVSRFPAGLANLGMLRLMATSLLPGWRRRQSALQNEWSIRHPSKARWLLGIDGA